MDLYTLTDQFLSNEPVDEFVSAIWTERYFSAGEVQIVVPATLENIEKLTPGTFLALRGTKEVMELQTQTIEDRLMTVVGSTLLNFLGNRIVWFKNPNYDEEDSPYRIVDYTDATKKPGEFIADVVNKMVINPVPITGVGTGWPDVNLDWEYETIDHLELGPIDTSGAAKRLTIPTGELYSGIELLARQEGVGISLYLDSAFIDTGYTLKFTTYQGKDRTTGSAFPLVRLTPDMDSLSEIEEVRSNAIYKNVCYVWYQNKVTVHYENSELPKPEGFQRRALVIDAEGEPVGRKVTMYGGVMYGGGWTSYVVGPTEIADFRAQNAKDALANHNYIQAIDGQTSPQNDYKYGIDYGLGDIIELENITGLITKARVTEYIRTQDKNGEREYPTISVITPEGGA